jgi:hypothetical protein
MRSHFLYLILLKKIETKLKNQIVMNLDTFHLLLGIYFAVNRIKSKQMEVIRCL